MDCTKGARNERDCAWKKRDNGEGGNKKDHTEVKNDINSAKSRIKTDFFKGRNTRDSTKWGHEISSAERVTREILLREI